LIFLRAFLSSAGTNLTGTLIETRGLSLRLLAFAVIGISPLLQTSLENKIHPTPLTGLSKEWTKLMGGARLMKGLNLC
jgi:hypothetical protein